MIDILGSVAEGSLELAGRYELLRPIGSGGMGRVWRARDGVLNREVAVKELRLPEGLSESEQTELRERAMREARTVAALDHPNIITVHDVLLEDDRPWIVMSLIDGRSLDRVVSADGPLPPKQVAELGLALLAALDTAHRQGIQHRDIKPPNVMLSSTERAILTDFGIASVAGATRLTAPGQVVGTLGYVAPERLAGQPYGPAADLWALGATLYYAVEGRPAYTPADPDDPLGLVGIVLAQDPEPIEHAGLLGPILTALLRRDPDSRPDAATAREQLQVLLAMSDGSDRGPTSPATSTGRDEGARPDASGQPTDPPASDPGPDRQADPQPVRADPRTRVAEENTDTLRLPRGTPTTPVAPEPPTKRATPDSSPVDREEDARPSAPTRTTTRPTTRRSTRARTLIVLVGLVVVGLLVYGVLSQRGLLEPETYTSTPDVCADLRENRSRLEELVPETDRTTSDSVPVPADGVVEDCAWGTDQGGLPTGQLTVTIARFDRQLLTHGSDRAAAWLDESSGQWELDTSGTSPLPNSVSALGEPGDSARQASGDHDKDAMSGWARLIFRVDNLTVEIHYEYASSEFIGAIPENRTLELGEDLEEIVREYANHP